MHPVLFHVGPVAIPVAGAIMALGVVAALALSERTARLLGFGPERMANAGLLAMAIAYVASRLLLALANLRTLRTDPLVLLRVPSLTPTALVLAVALTLLWLRRRGVPVPAALDAWAPCAALLWAFVAAGHAVDGSDPGMPAAFGWAGAGGVRSYPVAACVAVAALALCGLLYTMLTRPLQRGTTAAAGLTGAGVVQFLLTFLRRPGQQVFGLDALQWLALGMIAGGATLAACAGAGRARQARVG